MYTQEDADQIDRKYGAIPIGQYIKANIKREYQCPICNNIYLAKPNTIRSKKQLQCPNCGKKNSCNNCRQTQYQANQLDIAVGAIPVGEYIGSKIKRAYECVDCKKIYYSRPEYVRQDHQITCQKCGRKRTGIKLKNNIKNVKKIIQDNNFEPIFNDSDYINCESKILIRCHCGKSFRTNFHSIQSGLVKSCGHCKDPNVGDRFGSLTIIDKKENT